MQPQKQEKEKKAKKIEILGVGIDVLTMDQAVSTVRRWLTEPEKRMIFTVNPEIIMLAKDDPDFSRTLNQADMVTADGIGVVMAAKKLGTPLPERVAGYDLQLRLFAGSRRRGGGSRPKNHGQISDSEGTGNAQWLL